jgi:hypothetical protein
VKRAAPVAILAVAIALACHARAEARTEYCPATLWYRPAIPATGDGRSNGLVYGLVAGAPRTIVSAKIVADTDGGWYAWDVANVPLTEQTNKEAESTRQVVTFGRAVFVRHAWIVQARTSGDAFYGWDAVGDAACGIPSFGHASYYAAQQPQSAQGFPVEAATAIAPLYTMDCPHPFMEAKVAHAVQPRYPASGFRGPSYTSQIEVQVGDSDNLLDAWIYKTSGDRVIDRSALAAARASSYNSAVSYCQKANGDYLFRADFEPY